MIKINFNKRKIRKRRRMAFAIGCVALAATPFAYLKRVEITGAVPALGNQKSVVRSRTSSPEKSSVSYKRKTPAGKNFRVAGFVRFGDRDFAMLISKGRTLWVEEGHSAFGFKIAKIEEEGVFTESGPETDKKIFSR